MRQLLAALAFAGALLFVLLIVIAPAFAQQFDSDGRERPAAADDRYPSWANRMRGYEPAREWKWQEGGAVASRYDCRRKGQCSKSKRTASGQRFVASGLTFAHRTLQFGTRLRFSYGGRSIVCTCNDRGPFVRGRTYDLAAGCADAIGMRGIARIGAARI